jgi:hypothetical protein
MKVSWSAGRIAVIVLVVLFLFAIGFMVFDLFIFRKHIATGAKVRMEFMGCPTVLSVAIMGMHGEGLYYDSASDPLDSTCSTELATMRSNHTLCDALLKGTLYDDADFKTACTSELLNPALLEVLAEDLRHCNTNATLFYDPAYDPNSSSSSSVTPLQADLYGDGASDRVFAARAAEERRHVAKIEGLLAARRHYSGTGGVRSDDQDRANIAYCEGGSCTGHYGVNSTWVRGGWLDTSSPAATAAHQLAARNLTGTCTVDSDCFTLPACNLSDPEQVVTVEGVKYSLNCPLLPDGNADGKPLVDIQHWNPNANSSDANGGGPAVVLNGPLGCPLQKSLGHYVSGARAPCIQGRCAMWKPSTLHMDPSTSLSTKCTAAITTDPLQIPAYIGEWTSDKEDILATWGKGASLVASQHVSSNLAGGLFVPCDTSTTPGRCSAYGALGASGGPIALQGCNPSASETGCPSGKTCVSCTENDESKSDAACPSDFGTTSKCPAGTGPTCNVCVGAPRKGNVMLVPMRAEGTVLGHDENGYNVRWDAIQCLYPYRDGKYMRCRILRRDANKAIHKFIFGSGDPNDSETAGNPLGIPILPPPFQASNAWKLRATKLKKSDLTRIHTYSIKNRDPAALGQFSSGPCTPAPNSDILNT